MSTQPKIRLTPEEYLRIERQAKYKTEYFDGEVYAMTGASRRHNLICGNLYASIHAQLRRRSCEVYSSDMRIKVAQSGLYTYPMSSSSAKSRSLKTRTLTHWLTP